MNIILGRQGIAKFGEKNLGPCDKAGSLIGPI